MVSIKLGEGLLALFQVVDGFLKTQLEGHSFRLLHELFRVRVLQHQAKKVFYIEVTIFQNAYRVQVVLT